MTTPLPLDTIVTADCLTYLAGLPDACVDLACVDPPYALKKADWDSWPDEASFLTFTYGWLDALLPKLKPGASLYVFNTPKNSAYILTHLAGRGLTFQNWITWDKRDGFSATTRRFVPTQETVLFFTAPGRRHTFNADAVRVPYESTDRIAAAAKTGILKNGRRWFPNPAGRLVNDVWHISSERHKRKVGGRVQKQQHVTPKPLDLIERIVLASSNPGDVVLDCFLGTGTTAVAAMLHGRHFLACEQNPHYVEIAAQRLHASSARAA